MKPPGPDPGDSEDGLLAANQRHDAHYGWSYEFSALYTNPRRRPETCFGPIEDYWQNRPDPNHPKIIV